MKAMSFLLIALVQAYRWLVSPILPPSCRFWPSCSEYALEAIRLHGPVTGGWLAARRLVRCQPWGGLGGHDPVPAPPGRCCEAAGESSGPNPRRSEMGGSLV